MRLEGFSKRGMELGSNPEQLYDKFEQANEHKNDLRQQYLNTIKSLAKAKMEHDILFEGCLETAMRRLSSLGFVVSKENMLSDIRKEIDWQSISLDFEVPDIDVSNIDNETQSSIQQLKNNLDNIFSSIPSQDDKPVNYQQTIPPSSEKTSINDDKIKEQSFDDIYENEIRKLSELKKSNDPNYEVELNNTIARISSLTDKIPNIREQIESDISYQNQHQEDLLEYERFIQDQINAMYESDEFSLFQGQNNQDEIVSSEMRR